MFAGPGKIVKPEINSCRCIGRIFFSQFSTMKSVVGSAEISKRKLMVRDHQEVQDIIFLICETLS